MHFFEQPCPAGWVYPCTLEEIAGRLAALPAEDVAGLWAVGLVPATRKKNDANGVYYFGKRPAIHLYSYPDTLQYKQPPHTKQSGIETNLCVELAYGMTFERQGSRFVCCWAAADLRCFTLEHVLIHEVGHHVYQLRRQQWGGEYRLRTRESEQFAEDYALRHEREATLAKKPKFLYKTFGESEVY